jgi:hypothetical protein
VQPFVSVPLLFIIKYKVMKYLKAKHKRVSKQHLKK